MGVPVSANAKSDRRRFWESVSLRSRIIFYSGVFSLFACLGFLTLMVNPVQLHFWQAAASVGISGGSAIIYAALAVRRKFFWFAPLIVIEIAVFTLLGQTYANNVVLSAAGSPLRHQLTVLAIGGMITLIAGYTLFITFFQGEGARYFKAHAEIQLAQEIHRALVPKIERSIGGYSIYGASFPSGEVGGDLVDVVEGGSWTAYVADVSGHGVSAGVLMAMFKTAVRSSVNAQGGSHALLNDVHRALYPLKTANLFVTAGVLHCDAAGKFSLSMAGHPPLLHFRIASGRVEEHAAEDLPLGVLPEQSFQTRAITVDSGDLLVLLTDGLTEVFDAKQNEMGIEPVKKVLRENAQRPLPEIFEAIRNVALKFGKQDDDQTLLLVRAS